MGCCTCDVCIEGGRIRRNWTKARVCHYNLTWKGGVQEIRNFVDVIFAPAFPKGLGS